MGLERQVNKRLGVLPFAVAECHLAAGSSQGQVSDLPPLRFFIMAMDKDSHRTVVV